MSLFISIIIGIAVNLDNLLIGMNVGAGNQKISFRSNLAISLASGLFALLPTALSQSLFSAFQGIANRIGAGLLIFYGFWCFKTALSSPSAPESPPSPADTLSCKHSILLGIFLAINCIPPAISAGAFRLPAAAIGFFCFLFSFLSLWVGNQLGLHTSGHPSTHYLPHISAVLFILMGYAGLWL